MKWIANFTNSLLHWISFGIIASFIPFMVFVELTKEPFCSGTHRILTEATIKGNIALLMIPLVGGLIGETVVRSFYIKGLEILAAISGILLFALLVSYANEFRTINMDSISNDTKAYIILSTKWLFGFMVAYAVSVMALSSSTE